MSNLLKSALAGLILALCLIGTAIAGPFEDGRAAYDRRDYAAALALLRPLADQGDAKAQARVGIMYANGEGVPQDYGQAVEWSRKAADQGLATGQANLGIGYYNGQGVPQDYVQAVVWLRKAADQGHARAQMVLGFAYQQGQGVPQDYVQAVAWYRKAAGQGEAYALQNLGYMYGNGEGVPQDYAQAYKWLSLSAARMTVGAERANVVADRDWFAARLSATRLTQAQNEASSWRPRTATASVDEYFGGSSSPWFRIFVLGVFLILVIAGIIFAGRNKTRPTKLDSDRNAFSTGDTPASVGLVDPVISPEAAAPQTLPVRSTTLQNEQQAPTAETANMPKTSVRHVAPMTTAYRAVFIVLIFLAILGLISGGPLTVIFGYSAWLMHKRKNVELVKCFRVLSYFYGIVLFVILGVIIYVSGDGYTVNIYLFILSVMATGFLLLCIFLLSFFKPYITGSAEAPIG